MASAASFASSSKTVSARKRRRLSSSSSDSSRGPTEAEKREAGRATNDFLQKKLSAMKETRDKLPLERPLLKSSPGTGESAPFSSKMHTPSASVHKALNTLESLTVAQSEGETAGAPRVTLPSSSSQPAKRRRTLPKPKMQTDDSLKSTTVSTRDTVKTTETGALDEIKDMDFLDFVHSLRSPAWPASTPAEPAPPPVGPRLPAPVGPRVPAPRPLPSAAPFKTDENVKVLQNRAALLEQNNKELRKMLAAQEEKCEAAEDLCAMLRLELESMSKENAELKAQLQTQKSVSGLSRGATWQYKIDDRWEAFPPEANEHMHQAYLEHLKKKPSSRYTTINSGGVDRLVDFEQMQQKHLATQKVRHIRVSAGVPPQWVTPAAELLQQGNELEPFYREVTDQKIWDSILHILQNTGHAWDASKLCSSMGWAEIKSVHRIENMVLWHAYKRRFKISVGSADLDLDGYGNIMARSQPTFDCGEPLALDVDEKILLHGTSWHNANSIVRQGFDHRTCKTAFYGAGVYFACAACKSHQYTHAHSEGRTLIIARVALGDSYVATKTRKNERLPPARSDSPGYYGSIVVKPGMINGHHNQQQMHQEYVIFDREQAYPCYVVQYTV